MKPLDRKALAEIAQQLENKALLERAFLPRVRSVLDRLAATFRQSFADTGMVPDFRSIRQRLTVVLTRHYQVTSGLFADVVLEDIADVPDGARELRDLAMTTWIEERAPRQSSAIVTTSERRIPSAVTTARITLQEEEGGIATNAAIAAVAANLIRLNGRQRAPSIASFETQVAAETTKAVTAQAVSGRVPFPLAGISPPVSNPIEIATKLWQTEEDELVRDPHALANQQSVPIDQPFIVGGQRLMFPGDTSAGASLNNVIRCRCGAIYTGE